MNHYQGWPFAKGSEKNLGAATAVWLGAAVARGLAPGKVTNILLALVTPIWLIVLYFFRDPERDVLVQDGLVISPADGEVVEIVHEQEHKFLNRPVVRISIFLNLHDVHVQRVPISGTVRQVVHVPGQFLQAFRPEASEVNEYIATVIETADGRPVLVKQIAGILARRCVSYMAEGQPVVAGDRLGIIRFSSRVDLFLPPEAAVTVQLGDKVYGGITPLARLN
jgi:phosphatidylserine decarboxylase